MRRFTNLIIVSGFLLTISVFTLLCTPGCAKKPQEPNEIKIGAILPLTGDGAKYGQSAKKGIDLALKEINTAGGIHNKKLKIIYEDSILDPKQGVNAANKLITVNKVPVIIGAMASSVTLAIAPIAEKSHTILLSPASSAPDITKAGDYIFRNTYSDIYEGPVMARYAYEKLGFRQIAILHINNDFGVGLSKAFQQSFVQLGGKIVDLESYENSSDFRSQLNKVKQSNPDSIYLVGYSEMGLVIRQAKEMALNNQILSCIMFEDPKILEVAGDAAEGVIYTYPTYNPNSNQQDVVNFVQIFRQKYNEEPDIYAASSYDSLKILAYAMNKGGLEAASIKQTLYSIKDFPGVTGSTTFDNNGDVTKPIGIKQVQNGKFTWLETKF
ncbi:MAG: penicillin-binding protein activator [Phycisphaerae bacterium]